MLVHSIIYYFLFLSFLPIVISYLDNKQWITIHSILKNKNKYNVNQLRQVNNIVYKHYYFWATNYAFQFKKLHRYKCKEIKQEELNMYAFIAVYKSIKNYDPIKYPNITFATYTKKYILSELYEGMTTIRPLTNIPKNELKKSYFKRKKNIIQWTPLLFDNNIMYKYNNRDTSANILDKHYQEVWNKIHSADISTFTKKILYLKFSFELKKIRSNKKIADLLGTSEEHVRTQLHNCREYFMTVF